MERSEKSYWVSIPIRDLMNLNHDENIKTREDLLVSIPIRDLMNLNQSSRYNLTSLYDEFQSLLGI